MIFEAAVFGLVLGLLCGGSVQSLLNVKLRGIGFLILSVFASVLPRLPLAGEWLSSFGTPVSIIFAVVRYGFLAAFVAVNLRCYPVCMIGAGGLMNFAVTIANGGVMPVSADILGTGSTDRALVLLKQGLIPNYGLMGGGTKLKALGDIFRIRVFFLYYLSLGDIMIAVGIFLLIFFLMEPKRIMAGRLRSGKNS